MPFIDPEDRPDETSHRLFIVVTSVSQMRVYVRKSCQITCAKVAGRITCEGYGESYFNF